MTARIEFNLSVVVVDGVAPERTGNFKSCGRCVWRVGADYRGLFLNNMFLACVQLSHLVHCIMNEDMMTVKMFQQLS